MTRQLYTGENLAVMQGLDSNIADLIYLDPPFNSNRDYGEFDDRWNPATFDTNIESEDILDLLDSINKLHSFSMMAYCAFMYERLLEMKRILKDSGSIYLHCDPTASHYLKVLMDSVFGKSMFQNEIIWSYRSGGATKRRFSKKHDTILFYAGKNYQFNPLKEKAYEISKSAKAGRKVMGKYHIDYYQDDKGVYNFVNMRDVWEIPFMSTTAKERTGYPTQKPVALLERIIKASSNFGDIVFDPFCGCGVTLICAEKFGRNWIGIDKNDNHELLEKLAINNFGELTFDYTHKVETND